VVISTDMLAEGVHFNLGYVPLKHLGYKAVVVNLSDIAAMNATPTQILVSVAVSNRFPVEALEEIYAGIALACNRYKVDLIGGDTTSSNAGLVISVTAIGLENEEKIVKRNGAKPNDLFGNRRSWWCLSWTSNFGKRTFGLFGKPQYAT
jgi:thiamine-monophosphate kinase